MRGLFAAVSVLLRRQHRTAQIGKRFQNGALLTSWSALQLR
jgi:hypothetical protein